MRLRYMELRNYRKFRYAAVEFPDGVVAIVGPNGTGKTTLLEAVTWALFGNESSVVRDGKDGVMTSGASPGEECSVVLEFDLGEDTYRLVRSMKGKSLKVDASLEVNGNVVAKGDTDVSRSVASRLGMDHKAFFVSVFAKQKDLNALANLKPAERKTLVLRMLGVDFLDDVIRNVDRDAKNAKREAEQLSGLLKDQQGRDKEEVLKADERSNSEASQRVSEDLIRLRADLQQASETVRAAKAAWEAEEERYREDVVLERRMTGLRASLQAKHASLARLGKELDELERLRASLPDMEKREAEYQQARADLDRHTGMRESFLRRKKVEEDIAARREEMDSLRKETEQTALELTRIPDVEANLSTVEDSLEETRGVATSIASQVRLAEVERQRMNASLRESVSKAEEIGSLGEDANCPTCLRRMGQQYTDLLRRYGEEQASLEKGLQELEAVSSSLMEQREKNEQRKKALEDRRRKFLDQSRLKASLEERVKKARQSSDAVGKKVRALEDELAMLGPSEYDQGAHDLAKRRVQELEPAHLTLSRSQAKMERLPQAVAERDEVSAALAEEEGEMRLVGQARLALAFEDKVLQQRRKDHEDARGKEGLLAQNIIRAEGESRRLASELESLRKRSEELRAIRERHRALSAEQETLNRLAQIMKGFKENVISRIVPTLSEVSSDMLSQLTEGKYGGMRLDDEYQMYLYDQGEEHRLERFSGGETDLANLCLRLAISRMIMERSGSQMNFLVLDEIFGSQDQSRKRNILETLGQLQKQFRQILLITHIDDVKDNVSSVLRVREKEDGSSTVALED